MVKFFIETRVDNFHWTREGCNKRKDGKFVPYSLKRIRPEKVVEQLKQQDDPMWQLAEYRTVYV